MSLKDLKNEIITYIDQIINFDLSKLYPEGPAVILWNSMEIEETRKMVEDIISILKKMKKYHSVLNSVTPNYLNDLKNNLNNFITQFQSLNNLNTNQITSHHHNALNHLNNISNILRASGLYVQLKFAPNFNEVTEKLKEANQALKEFNVEEFRKAIALVRELIKEKISFEEKTIEEHLGTFLDRANEHKIYKKVKFVSWKFSGHWWWLMGSFLMGIIVAYIIHSFIVVLESNGNISAGAAILRVSSLIIPSYFMIFFVNQFLYHKKMYEIYSFKNTALNTMTNLMRTNEEKADYILQRGLEVLFSEPKIKESGKYDSHLINELISMLKGQLSDK